MSLVSALMSFQRQVNAKAGDSQPLVSIVLSDKAFSALCGELEDGLIIKSRHNAFGESYNLMVNGIDVFNADWI